VTFDMPESNVMAVNKWVAISLGAAACLTGVAVAVLLTPRCPLDVRFANMEPSGVLNDSDNELSFATLTVSNKSAGNIHFANDQWLKVETKIANQWVVQSASRCNLSLLGLHQSRDLLVVTPASATACRLHMKYLCGDSLIWRLAQHLGPFTALLPRSFWRYYWPPGQNPRWREETLEVSLH
jgi:hypothetical protein